MDQVVVIRHKYNQEEQSIRPIAREMGLNRKRPTDDPLPRSQ